MSQKDKLIEKIISKPIRSDITFEELYIVALHFGFEIKNGGSHIILKHPPARPIPISIHGKYSKAVGKEYLKQFISTLHELELIEDE